MLGLEVKQPAAKQYSSRSLLCGCCWCSPGTAHAAQAVPAPRVGGHHVAALARVHGVALGPRHVATRGPRHQQQHAWVPGHLTLFFTLLFKLDIIYGHILDIPRSAANGILVLASPEFIIPLSIHGRYYLFYLSISGNDFTYFIIWTQFEFYDQDFAWLKFVLFLWFVQCYLLITGKSKIVKLCTKLMFAFRFYKWKGLNFKLIEIEKSIMPQ